ncbi:hypothetical protein MUG78_10710 [Gordonia alkaliphila]|uniref:hypothetical protein n=1 Tax=Gordonia alkaliphila TaxID=1053547 RepID=UPI001FF21171|nr:hypothetical protein [Gordonia alkaliphila]MCK0439913.1 hypothetical protein [Gordonia alkaliphila]
MTEDVRLDAAGLDRLIARQHAVAQTLAACAQRLALRPDWAQSPAHREAAAALDQRLDHIVERLTAASAGAAGLAERIGSHAAAVVQADRESVGEPD